MPAGRIPVNALLDTASDPDDTTLVAAQGLGTRIYFEWLDVIVTTGQASSEIRVEDGVGGSVLLVQASTAAGTTQYRYVQNDKSRGLRFSENTAANATIEGATGVAARIVGEAVVHGG